MSITRRSLFVGAGAAALSTPAIAQRAQVLRMVPQANLTSIDPIWTTANVTRNHAYMIYDTLYGLDSSLRPRPQMAAGHVIEDDGRRVTITLRAGLIFHDGTKVTARDCIASIQRWSKRNPFGQKLATVIDSLDGSEDRNIVFRLKKPFPLLFNALASIGNPCVVMPERIAATDPFKQIIDATGSGPFRFKKDEYNSGSLVVYERHHGYTPCEGAAPSLTAGPKRAFFDRVEWHIITDAATASAALQKGEIDWFEQLPVELQEVMRRNPDIAISPIDTRPNPAVLRLNFLHPPFNDVAARRALLPAISQADFMGAIVGDDPALMRTDLGAFEPETPLATDAGMEVLTGPRSLDRARDLLKACGATTPLTRLIGPTDILAPSAMTQVCADLFHRLGLNLDVALSDWGTVIQRRTSHEPVDKGGWSAFLTAFGSFDFADPAGHPALRGNGAAGWYGWPDLPRLEELRDAWFDTPDLASQQRIATDIQRTVIDEVAFIPVGCYRSLTALRADLKDRVSGFALFYGLRRA